MRLLKPRPWPVVRVVLSIGFFLAGVGLASSSAQAQEGGLARYAAAAPDAVELNRATLEEIETLPISADLARAIWEHRTYTDYFTSVYDLFKVPGMTSETFVVLRDKVIVQPKFAIQEDSEDDERLEAVYDAAQRLLSQEGASEGLVDEYIDLLRQPRNINDMDYYALTGIQNVSPVDAKAILLGRREKPYETTQELRRTPGLSYWGYRNIRDFVHFGDSSVNRWKFAGDAQIRLYNTPYELDDEDILVDQLGAAGEVPADDVENFDLNTLFGRLNIDQENPYATTKLRFRLGNEVKAGMITHRNLGEEKWSETLKWYGGVDNQHLGPLTLHRAYVGNYRMAFGQGLVMDNTDFFQARRNGIGFSVRPVGVRGDISRSDESALKGGAAEGSIGPLRLTGFYSNDDKDAILNPDGSFNRYITMVPRVSDETLEDIQDFLTTPAARSHFLPMRNVMNETIVGGNARIRVLPAAYIGFTAMEMTYRNNLYPDADEDSLVHRFNPDPRTLFTDSGAALLQARDDEFAAGYDNRDLGNFRDLVGSDFAAIFGNLALAGEYGKLLTAKKESFTERAFAAGPEAYLGSAYLQYENLNIQALYRDYDLYYDNPYHRGFSETNKYDQTLAGDEFRLWNPIFSYLAENDPQSKAERGFYLLGRYQVSRDFTINAFEYDNYVRKVDDTNSQRLTVNLEYRPIFPVRFRVRQRWSERDGKGLDEVRGFTGWDTRFEARFYLSNYNRLDFLYSTTNVIFKSRPRLGSEGDPDGGTTDLGTRASPGQAFQAKYVHNFTPGLAVTVSSEIYDGFLYNFEDNEFIALDGAGFRNWFLVRSRLSSDLSWRLKYTVDNQAVVTNLQLRNFESPIDPSLRPEGTAVKDNVNSFRFQLDYTF